MKLAWNAPGTLGLCGASLLVLGLSTIVPWLGGLFASPAGIDLADPLFFLQCIIHVLGHGDWQHYAGNMLLLLLLGPMVEQRYGTGWFVSIAALTAVVAALAALALGHRVLGASGVVFALIGLSSVAGARRGELPVTMLLVLGIYLGGEVKNLFADDNISQLSHIIGGFVGGAVGLALAPGKGEAA